MKDFHRIILILAGVIVVFGAIFLFIDYSEKRADMYILPDGFDGTATIFFSDPGGVPEKQNGQKRFFEIPSSGILHTQSIYKRKWNSYYVKSDSNLKRLMYGDARMGGIAAYNDLDSVWVQEMNVGHLDSNGRKLTIVTIIVKRRHYRL
ncbi:hypothetical protein KTO58_27990 [Chitinophaga pendula]|uniref:DUF6843 domain-containing protein n=1 Tax=Chitinophaga TaxID=79328 RepID=UPI0012FE2F8E|nr:MULTISPECIES: hypothetical protein [Chitinophaga]UCJ07456.1 hypothetical protein KTO58_27990 [Chitinophaga pendula]